MKTVHVEISRYGFDKWLEFDNVVSRDEIIHKVLSDNKELKRDREGRDFEWDNGVYVTWYDGDTLTAQAQKASLDSSSDEAPAAEPTTEPEAPATTEPEGTDAG